jgi:hypothetical protein
MIRHWGTGKTCHVKVAWRPAACSIRANYAARWRRFVTLTDPTAWVRES